ncbi:spore germination protein KA [Clostridium aceticum]|uniref:Spore germination protein KA n=2 Tax=Clostridium aceticum TaxID=84022 RepID=A0A0D8I6C8_9CLOT|nr:spore germination protein [Clostridium aceticum]AKL97118.1 spore germination protein KA [Clostridium aceticum]KJF25587.1 spore gernimation protein GerK [Clostridium aceticum]
MNEKKYQARLKEIKEKLGDNYDVILREIHTDKGVIQLIFLDSISDSTYISQYIISPLLQQEEISDDIEVIKSRVLAANHIGDVEKIDAILLHILSGDIILLFSFIDAVIYCSARQYSSRAIEEPPSEVVIKGPREGLTENIAENISLIRKKIRNRDLKFERVIIGEESNTTVLLVYIEGKAPQHLVQYIKRRLENINNHFLFEINFIEEELKCKRTPFDTIGYTEKPDVLVSKVSEGRVAILADSSPFALTAPHFFLEEIQMADDYYLNKYPQNYFRLIRWVALLIALLLPGLYVALTTYHFSLIPSIFVFRLAVLRAGVPFPTIVEVVIMMFFFQLLREAGIRLPQAIGPAISIVGALILGDAAIRSGMASEITVLVVALSAISLFLIPKLYGGVSIWTNIIMIFSALLGLPGFFIGFIVFCSHLASLDSCDYPYLYPLGTLKNFNFKDNLLRDDMNKISKNILKGDEKE